MIRSWQYFVVGASSDRDQVIADARDGAAELVRTVVGRRVEQTLFADNGWRDHNTLSRITHRNEDAWEFPVGIDDARTIVAHWHTLGQLPASTGADELLPPDLDARLGEHERATERQRVLRDEHALDARTLQRVRAMLDPVSARFADAWVSEHTATVVPVPRGPLLGREDDSHRCHAAFTLLAEEELHAVIRRPDLVSSSADAPDGVSCPNDPDWIVALGALPFAQTETVLTGPSRVAALFWTFDYALVAGPPVFVEAVINDSIDAAHATFRAYARHELTVEPAVDLADVVARYLPDGR